MIHASLLKLSQADSSSCVIVRRCPSAVLVFLMMVVATEVAARKKPTDLSGGRRRKLLPLSMAALMAFERSGETKRKPLVSAPDFETAEAGEGSADAEVVVALPDFGCMMVEMKEANSGAPMTAALGDMTKGFSLLRMHAGFELVKERVENDGSSEKSNSSSLGDVLGLGNYGSDVDDEDNEIESSSVPTPTKYATYQSGIKQPLADTHDIKTMSLPSNDSVSDQLHDDKVTRAYDLSHSSKVVPEDLRDNGLDAIQRIHDKFNGFSSKDTSGIPRSELLGKSIGGEKATDDHSDRESIRESKKNDRPATSDRGAPARQLKTHSNVSGQQDTNTIGLNLTARAQLLQFSQK
ncbi:hypothetical protein V8G54_023701 [Vigna mungo]|uniref:Uncharacterized protein n=1 Tax=Vigna mungo TaxID=3915 RepID=A0AAQ3N3M7_VIGMU